MLKLLKKAQQKYKWKKKFFLGCHSPFPSLSTNNNFPVWLRNRLISAGFEPVLSHTKKFYAASYYTIFQEY